MKPPIGHTHPPHACRPGGECPDCNAPPTLYEAACVVCGEDCVEKADPDTTEGRPTCLRCHAQVETHGAKCDVCGDVAWCVYLVQSTDEFRAHIRRRHGIARGSICRECEDREFIVMRGME